MTIDADEAAIRTVIAAAVAEYGEINGRGLDALCNAAGGGNREGPRARGVRDQAPELVSPWQNRHADSTHPGALTRCPAAMSSGGRQ
jgi:NAD(P)-dependent dehydrogenase (short-subunit alcohol dehydrogenase family)